MFAQHNSLAWFKFPVIHRHLLRLHSQTPFLQVEPLGQVKPHAPLHQLGTTCALRRVY